MLDQLGFATLNFARDSVAVFVCRGTTLDEALRAHRQTSRTWSGLTAACALCNRDWHGCKHKSFVFGGGRFSRIGGGSTRKRRRQPARIRSRAHRIRHADIAEQRLPRRSQHADLRGPYKRRVLDPARAARLQGVALCRALLESACERAT